MTEVRISVGTAQTSGPTPVRTGGVLAYSLRCFVKISAAAANFFGSHSPGSVERQAENGGAAAEAANAPLAADVNVNDGAGVTAYLVPDQREIERRRDLVRMLFNDFWNGASNKPAAFTQRLDQAEDYLNARLASQDELWRLDANTRAMLGLPPRSSSPV